MNVQRAQIPSVNIVILRWCALIPAIVGTYVAVTLLGTLLTTIIFSLVPTAPGLSRQTDVFWYGMIIIPAFAAAAATMVAMVVVPIGRVFAAYITLVLLLVWSIYLFISPSSVSLIEDTFGLLANAGGWALAFFKTKKSIPIERNLTSQFESQLTNEQDANKEI